MVDRSVKQTENRLEIRYSFITDTLQGFFTIEEQFSADVKLISHKLKAPYTFKENKLKITGASVKGLETFVLVFEGKGQVEMDCKAKFENYPWKNLENTFEKSTYLLQKTEVLAEVKKQEEPVVKNEHTKIPEAKTNSNNVENIKTQPVQVNNSGDAQPALVPASIGIRYRVQLAASSSKMDINRLKALTGLDQVVFEDIIDNLYKYTVGDETSLSEAQALLNKLAVNNFKKPFIVAYENGKRISIAKAQLK